MRKINKIKIKPKLISEGRSGSANFGIHKSTNEIENPQLGKFSRAQKSTLDILNKNHISSKLPDISQTQSDVKTSRKLRMKKSKGSFVPKMRIPAKKDHKASIDNLLNKIDNNYVDEYIQNAFEPEKAQKKLTKAQKIQRRKKIRIRYITDKIDKMRKQKTFLTSMNAVEEPEPESPEPEEEQESVNSEEERNQMLQELLDTQQLVRSGYDNLSNIRRMIRQTGENINNHMDTVGDLKVDLEFMDRRGQDFDH